MYRFRNLIRGWATLDGFTVLSAKSDSDVMFCFKVIRDLEPIDHLCITPIHRIGLINK